ncbi:hypothetical protein OJAG_28150 [Oerskovia enterophila]|uniref:Uncharacterized protein n=1 Tax=Oerskovia enterophila TaxID=43678 RepID=A0A163QTQ4_9CELL|nr:hypothetical protein OJAG_28150 [Oerskovia enterophila]
MRHPRITDYQTQPGVYDLAAYYADLDTFYAYELAVA